MHAARPRLERLLSTRLEAVRRRIGDALRAAGRPPGAVRLLAVTKSVPAEVAAALVRLGQTELGESRADELERKARHLRAALGPGRDPTWHFVGHLQRNKVHRVLAHARVIHSIDSDRLLAAVEARATEAGLRPDIYLQVKLVPDREKTGLAPAEVAALAERAAASAALRLRGLMTIGPREGDPRPTFDALAELARALDPALFEGGRPELSMGMTGDLEAAVAAGSDVVRVGSALFEGLDELEREAGRAAGEDAAGDGR